MRGESLESARGRLFELNVIRTSCSLADLPVLESKPSNKPLSLLRFQATNVQFQTHKFIFPLDLCCRDRRKAEIAQTCLLLPFGLSPDRPHPSGSEETAAVLYIPITTRPLNSCLTSNCNVQVRRIHYSDRSTSTIGPLVNYEEKLST